MFSTLDTIVAIATPLGRGGIGVVRVSGPEAHRIAQELTRRDQPFQPRHATLTTVRLKADTTYGPAVVASGGPAVVASGGPAVMASGGPAVVASGGPAVVASGGPAVVASGGPAVVASGGP